LWISADLCGEFGPLRCDGEPSELRLAKLAGSLYQEREQRRAEGLLQPIVVSAGDLLGDGTTTRFLLASGLDGAQRLGSLLSAMNFDLLVAGPAELRMEPELLSRLTRSGKTPLQFHTTNARCTRPTPEACSPALNHREGRWPGYHLEDRGGVRVALIPLLTSGKGLSQAGVAVDSAVAAALEAARRARSESSADVVVAIIHQGLADPNAQRAIQLAGRLRGVDLVVFNRLGERTGNPVEEIRFRPGDGPLILGVTGDPSSWLEVRFKVLRRAGRFVLGAIDATERPPGAPHAPTVRAFEDVSELYCLSYGAALGSSVFSKPMDGDEVTQYVLHVLQSETAADLAVIPRAMVALPTLRSLKGGLTRDVLYRTLPRNDRVWLVGIRGAALAPLLGELIDATAGLDGRGAWVVGASRSDSGEALINGRRLEPQRNYLVATVESALPLLEAASPPPAIEVWSGDNALPFRETIERWFSENRYSNAADANTISLDTNFSKLEDALLWSFRQDINGGFNLTRLTNAARYVDRSQLDRQEFMSLEGTAVARIDAQSPLHEWNTFLNIQYATNRVGSENDFNETKDLTQFESAYQWLIFRKMSNHAAWAPAPSLRLRVNTELTQSKDLAYHRFETTGIFGLTWKLLEGVTTGIGYSAGTELFDSNRSLRQGLSVVFEALRMPLLPIPDSPLTGEMRFDAFYTDIGEENTFEAFLRAQLAYSILGPLSITSTLNAYAFSTLDRELALACDFVLGLQVSMSAWVQAH
jgi:hypothetical protein